MIGHVKVYEGTWLNDVAKCGEMKAMEEEPDQIAFEFPKVGKGVLAERF